MWYKLDGKVPVPCDITEVDWDENNRVAHTKDTDGRIVSTIFLRHDHSYFGVGEPMLLETMMFEDVSTGEESYCIQCATWEEAEAQHQKVCDMFGIHSHLRFARRTYGED